MRGITLNANAKINLGLDVLGVREDGYHEVRMIMQSLELSDEIMLEKTGGEIVIRTDSTEIPSDQNNLCYKAAALMKREYGIEEKAQRPPGKWRHVATICSNECGEMKTYHMFKCSECDYEGNPDWPYCPHCGSPMA